MENSEAIVKSEPVLVSQRAIILADSLKADTEQRALLSQYIAKHMRVNVDFGEIPGTNKPSLLKPGAEKLVDLFRCTPKFVLLKDQEDFEKGFFNYMFRVRLVSRDSNAVLAEGFGSANSREGRYRWRNAQLKCPECKKETLFKSKHEPGFYCWAKKGGCGVTFGPNDQGVVNQALGKVENEDVATLANTILKMAKKRALVDGAIALARCSDMFTQDVEDLVDHAPDDAPAAPRSPPPPREAPRAAAPKEVREVEASGVKQARANRIWMAAKNKGVTKEGFQLYVAHILEGDAKPSKYWTELDMDKLEAGLGQLDLREPGDQG